MLEEMSRPLQDRVDVPQIDIETKGQVTQEELNAIDRKIESKLKKEKPDLFVEEKEEEFEFVNDNDGDQ